MRACDANGDTDSPTWGQKDGVLEADSSSSSGRISTVLFFGAARSPFRSLLFQRAIKQQTPGARGKGTVSSPHPALAGRHTGAPFWRAESLSETIRQPVVTSLLLDFALVREHSEARKHTYEHICNEKWSQREQPVAKITIDAGIEGSRGRLRRTR
jgi:hypothetical protein